MVVDKPATITYFFVNSGDAVAKNIRLEDSYPRNAFKGIDNVFADGTVALHVDELGIGKEISFNCTILPLMEGIYSSIRAEIRYLNGAVPLEDDEEYDDEEELFGYSSNPDELYILSEKDAYLSSTSIQWHESLTFLLLGGLSIIVPGITWMSTQPI